KRNQFVARIERSEMRGRPGNPHHRSRMSLRSIRATELGPPCAETNGKSELHKTISAKRNQMCGGGRRLVLSSTTRVYDASPTNTIGRTSMKPIHVALLLAATTTAAEARVTRIEITKREPFAAGQAFGTTGAYE